MLYFPLRRNSSAVRLYYLGFKGVSRVYKKEPGESLTIAAENAASSMVDGVKEKASGNSQPLAH